MLSGYHDSPVGWLTRSDRVVVTVHDLAGRRVRSLLDAGLNEGDHSIDWFARDDQGRALPSGPYFLRYRDSVSSGVQRVMLLR